MSECVTGHTGLLCLLGSPVAHSISPEMHNEAFRLLGLDYEYLAFDVAPERLEAAVNGLRALGVVGFNVTMPLKNQIPEYLDGLSAAAKIGGSVNTVVNDQGKLIGHTTDGIGFVKSAEAVGFHIGEKNVVQLGAGGAGIAIMIQMAIDGAASIDVFNQKDSFWPRTEAIVERLNQTTDCTVSLHELSNEEQLRLSIQQADLLLNTTPVGMEGIGGSLIPDSSYFHDGLVVADIIYHPDETPLLKMAREAGLFTFNGKYMLLYQGAASFRLWTGQDMPVEKIKEKYFH